MKRLKYVTISAAFGAALLSAPLQAQDPVASGADLADMAKSYARQFNVSTGEAMRRLQLQRKAARLAQRLQAEDPERFGGMFIENGPKYRIVARFKGDAGNDRVRRNTQDAELLSATETETVSESLAEIQGRQKALLASIKRAGVEAESGIDIKRSNVRILVLNREEALAKLKAAGVTLGGNVVVEQVQSFVVPTATFYGGYTIATATTSYLRNCTSGWNVVHTSGVKGVLTAGHCYNDAKYFTSRTASYTTTGGTALTFKTEANSGNYDLQWHSAASSTYPAQFYDGVSIKTVTAAHGWYWPLVGEWVCKYGITTEQTCGEIKDKWYWDTGYQGYYIHVSNGGIASAPMNKEGDSGGPVFVGSEAYGIVHGRNAVYDLFFMPLDLGDFGLTVLTQ